MKQATKAKYFKTDSVEKVSVTKFVNVSKGIGKPK
jgi:hypothetical protein